MYDWFDFLRVCLNCGIYKPPIDILCPHCWDYYKKISISNNHFLNVSLNYEFPVKRVWVWNKQNGHLIKKIIYNLKGGHSPRVYEKLSLFLLQKIIFNYYQERELIFIPAPAIKPKKNHALYFAKSLSDITGCDYMDLLIVDKVYKKQKRLRRQERAQKEYKVNNKVKFGRSTQVIFIDDVITTGSTARAAFRALGYPTNFEVWALAEKLYTNCD